MVPVTLQIKCDKFLKEWKNTCPTEEELHLLIDVLKMEEFPQHIFGLGSNKKTHFGYFILQEEKERDEFFMEFEFLKQFYENELHNRTNKVSLLKIHSDLISMGFKVHIDRIERYMNPVKVKIKLDTIQNKKDRRYYDRRSRSEYLHSL